LSVLLRKSRVVDYYSATPSARLQYQLMVREMTAVAATTATGPVFFGGKQDQIICEKQIDCVGNQFQPSRRVSVIKSGSTGLLGPGMIK
jgi:hypothetical protein